MKDRRAYYRDYDKNHRKKTDRKEYQRRYEKHRKKRDRKKYYIKYNKDYWKKKKECESLEIINKHEVEQNQFRGKTKMEIEYKGFLVKGTPQDIRELVSEERTMAGAFTEAMRNSEASVKKKYVMSGKYRKKRAYTKKNMSFWKNDKNRHKKKLFVMTEAHKDAIRKGVKKHHSKHKMSQEGRDNISRSIRKLWKNKSYAKKQKKALQKGRNKYWNKK